MPERLSLLSLPKGGTARIPRRCHRKTIRRFEMRNLILAAGVAALAITAPAAAKPDRDGGGDRQTQTKRGGGGQAKAQRGGGGRQAQVQRSGGGREFRAQRM